LPPPREGHVQTLKGDVERLTAQLSLADAKLAAAETRLVDAAAALEAERERTDKFGVRIRGSGRPVRRAGGGALAVLVEAADQNRQGSPWTGLSGSAGRMTPAKAGKAASGSYVARYAGPPD
jgi:hypothetical protein